MAITFEVKPSCWYPDTWIVGAVDHDSEGEIYTAAFVGMDAEERAKEYAAWKSGQERPTDWGKGCDDA